MATGLAKASEVAEFVGYTEAGLAQMRYQGTGPKFIKLSGRAVRYRWEDVEAWLDERTCTQTGQTLATA